VAVRTRDLTRNWRRGDAERLACFFNITGRGWPGGNWDPQSPDDVERHVRERRLLGCFVAEVGEKIVSFCSLSAKPTEINRAYVGLLTADPEFHGRGFGKAVLLRAIERAYERGIARVDLHTWPGNMKAVPLYKKSGFMWSPESSQWGVYMQNFTPAARRNPIAQEYFAKHDWYQTMKRDLSLTPDDHKRGKVRAYEYEWEADGDRLRVVYDRNSWGLIEMETNEFLVACSLPDEKLIAGVPQRVAWRIVSYRDNPLDVVLVARGDEGLTLDHKELLQVGDECEVATQFEIAPEIADKEGEPRAQIVRTDLLLDGRPIRLEAGFQVKQVVNFSLDGDGRGLRPGRSEPVTIQCWNEAQKPVRAKLRLAASAAATLAPASVDVRLPARGSAEIPVTLATAESASVVLKIQAQVQLGRRTIQPKPGELHAQVLRPGDVVGHVARDDVVLESATLSLSAARRGGWISVTDKIRNRGDVVGMPAPQVGPPFGEDEFFDSRCEARVERNGGQAVAILTTPSIYRSGVVLERRITLSNLPLIAVEDVIVNGSGDLLDGRVRTAAAVNVRGGQVTAPTKRGIVGAAREGAGRGLDEHQLGHSAADWPEGWFAMEGSDGLTAALLWERAERVDALRQWSSLERRLPAARPGEPTTAGPLYLFVGEGGSLAVRRWWQTLFGSREDREQRPLETRRPLEFGLRPRPLVLHGRTAQAALAADAVGRLTLGGRLEVRPPSGLRVRPARAEFQGLNEKRGRRKPVTVSRVARLPEGAYFVECAARIDRAIYRERQPIIVLGDPSYSVEVTQKGREEKLFRTDNGLLTLTVAPGFQGCAVGLERNGEQLLRSAYPKAHPLAFSNPWFGGIQPRVEGLAAHELFREGFSAREIARRGSQGIRWRGIRVSCSPKQERSRHQRFTLDYLLAPGSAIFAIASRTTRRADTAGWCGAGFDLWPIIGGSHLDAVLSGQADARASRVRCEFGGELRGDGWAIAENPKAGEAVVLAGPGGEAGVRGHVCGGDGYFLAAGRGATQAARETRESVFFVSFTDAERARDLAEALSELKGLP